ncbi:hypothetical protein Pelo_8201 [Pelomyxa schiedti]|nr:hypothetical protein Pelo_8201 [Pelomyxa schiedti]
MYEDRTIMPLLYSRPYPHSVYEMEDTGVIVKRYNPTLLDGESMPCHREWWNALRRWVAVKACQFSTNVQRYESRPSADDYTVTTRGDSPYECPWSTFHACMLDTSPFRESGKYYQRFFPPVDESYPVFSDEIGSEQGQNENRRAHSWLTPKWNFFRVQLLGHLLCYMNNKLSFDWKMLDVPPKSARRRRACYLSRIHLGVTFRAAQQELNYLSRDFPPSFQLNEKLGWKFDFLAMAMDDCLPRTGVILAEALNSNFKVFWPCRDISDPLFDHYPIIALAKDTVPWQFFSCHKPEQAAHLKIVIRGWGWHWIIDGIRQRFSRAWVYHDSNPNFPVPSAMEENWDFEILGGWGLLQSACEAVEDGVQVTTIVLAFTGRGKILYRLWVRDGEHVW